MRRVAAVLTAALLAAGLAGANSASACSMSAGYKVPTNLELAVAAEVIVVARLDAERVGKEAWGGVVLAKPIAVLKGTTLPDVVELKGTYFADDDRSKRMVVASGPRELRSANPGALIGGCVRYIFTKGMNVVLFLRRDESGKLVPDRHSFSRDAEDVAGVGALWVKAVREYGAISLLPRGERRAALRKRADELRKMTGDPDAQAIAVDMEVELKGKRLPNYD